MGEAKLKAKCSILYLSKMYEAGDVLPVNDDKMVSAWLEAGTAAWETMPPHPVEHKAIGRLVTATPGIPGGNSTGTETDGDDLVGKVPATNRRKKK